MTQSRWLVKNRIKEIAAVTVLLIPVVGAAEGFSAFTPLGHQIFYILRAGLSQTVMDGRLVLVYPGEVAI